MALKKDSLTKKLNDFFVMNWWLTGISNIIIIILFIYYSINLSDYKDETTKRINQANLHIIYGTPDGRVALLDRQTVNTDNEVFQNHIALIAKNMETSESQLTHGFDPNIASKIVSPVDLLKVNENFVLLYKEFFANKNVTLSFLRYYFNLLKAGNLAKKNTILKTTYQYSPDPNRKNGFEMKITFKTQKDFIDKVSNIDKELIVNDIIFIKGFIDPTKYSTTLNPFGVKFTSVKLGIYNYNDYVRDMSR